MGQEAEIIQILFGIFFLVVGFLVWDHSVSIKGDELTINDIFSATKVVDLSRVERLEKKGATIVLHFGDMQKQALPSALMGAPTRRRLKKALEEALEANRVANRVDDPFMDSSE